MSFNKEPVNRVQTAFSGARCEFEVERSKEGEIEVYSSKLRNCGSDSDFDVTPFFEVKVIKDGRFGFLTSRSGFKPEYLDFSDAVISRDQGPSVTIYRLAMTEEGVKLISVYFYVLVKGIQQQQDICDSVVWKSAII
jgi:hypothetical protein